MILNQEMPIRWCESSLAAAVYSLLQQRHNFSSTIIILCMVDDGGYTAFPSFKFISNANYPRVPPLHMNIWRVNNNCVSYYYYYYFHSMRIAVGICIRPKCCVLLFSLAVIYLLLPRRSKVESSGGCMDGYVRPPEVRWVTTNDTQSFRWCISYSVVVAVDNQML